MILLTPDELEKLGLALFGDNWEGTLASRLRLSRRTVSRWRDGTHCMPAGLLTVLLSLVEQQAAALAERKRYLTGEPSKVEKLEGLFYSLAEGPGATLAQRRKRA